MSFEKIVLHNEKNVFQSLFGGDSPTFSSPSSSGRTSPTVTDILEDNLGDDSCEEGVTMYRSSEFPQNPIRIMERKALGIAHQLWPAAAFLGDFLATNPQILSSNNEESISVIELGAGLGLTGLFLSSFFDGINTKLSISQVILTDLPEALAGLKENIALNDLHNKVDAQVLTWGNVEEAKEVMSLCVKAPPVVIAADVVYWECLFGPLVDTLVYLCNVCHCTIIVAHIKRWKKDNKFFGLCKKRNLIVETLHEEKIMIQHEHTKEDSKQLRKIYRIVGGK